MTDAEKASKLRHDIRNCLTVIRADAELGRLSNVPAQAIRDSLESILEEVTKIDELLKESKNN